MMIMKDLPYSYAFELKKNRISLDEHEKSEEHLKNSEVAYLELASFYNWVNINCIKDGSIRTIENINDEIMDNIKEFL